mgnify:CR=1 FL=1|tara:strand:- start:78 stop:644 length:567 start_codon:yes stop_codon:yes gene_type:complete
MDWFNIYREKLGSRYQTFEILFSIAMERGLKNIVETGTARGKEKFYYIKPRINWKDGMSTILFAHYASENKGNFWSCDIDKKNIKNASYFLKKFNFKANLVVADSLKFLKEFSKKIDILYLDSLDGQMPGANEHQLKEAQIALNKMNINGLILLDDKGQKTELSTKFLSNNGWKIEFETTQQIILIKK